jgi:hypothetical protein
VVESNLNALARARARRCEVINAGVPGYTTWQELEFLRQYGLSMQPDLVVLGFVYNDLFCPTCTDPSKATSWLGNRPRGCTDSTRAASRACCSKKANWPMNWRGYSARRPVCSAANRHSNSTPRTIFTWPGSIMPGRKRPACCARCAICWPTRDPAAGNGLPVSEQLDDRALKLDRRRALFPERKIGAICAELICRC